MVPKRFELWTPPLNFYLWIDFSNLVQLSSILSYVHSKYLFYFLDSDFPFQKDKAVEPMENDIFHLNRDCSIFVKVAVEKTFEAQTEVGDSILFLPNHVPGNTS